MATLTEFGERLRSKIGTIEQAGNRNPFSAALGRPPEAWCADLLVAVAREVDLKLPSESAYTPTSADAYRRAGRWSPTPVVGAWSFWDFPDAHRGIQHVEWIEAIPDPLHLIDIGGNTSSGTAGSQDNGDGVYRRTRALSLGFVGCGLPAYDNAAPALGHGYIADSDEEHEMGAVIPRPQGGYITVAHDGGVFQDPKGIAPYHGSIPEHPEWKVGGNVVGGTWTESGQGYWITTRDGAIYPFGDAVYNGRAAFNTLPAEVRGGRYIVGMVRTHGTWVEQVAFDPHEDGTPYDGYEFEMVA